MVWLVVNCVPQCMVDPVTKHFTHPSSTLDHFTLEVKPAGENGERYLMTVICASTRYPFFRPTITREAVALVMLWLDIMLDCGVVPAILQSDNEFISLTFEN